MTVVAAVAGTAAAVGLALSGTGTLPEALLIGAALAHVPAAAVFLSATAVIFAVAPRLCIPLGWSLLAGGLILGQFGELLRLPSWVQDLSPFRHSAVMPVEPFDPAAALALTAVALLGAGIAAYLIRRRDLTG